MSEFSNAWRDELRSAGAEVESPPKLVDVTLTCGYHGRPLERTDPPAEVTPLAGRYFRCPDPTCPVVAAVIVGAPGE